MEHLKTFEQFDEVLNENFITDAINKFSGKIKKFIREKLLGYSPEDIEQMKNELSEYKDLSFKEIQNKVRLAAEDLSENLTNEYYEPKPSQYGRPSPDSYKSQGLTISGLINRILTGGVVVPFLTLLGNWFTTDVLGKAGLSDPIMGFSVLIMLASALIWLVKNALFAED